MSMPMSQPIPYPGPSLLGHEEPAPLPGTLLPKRSLGHQLALAWEVVTSSLTELWAHKLRSMLTLTLLTLGVFALVVMISTLDGVVDKVSTGFAGLSWDGTLMVVPKSPETSEEQKRFAMSPGLKFEDISRLCSPHEKVAAFMPRASRQVSVKVAGGVERVFVAGVSPVYFPVMNRTIANGRALTEDDQRRRSAVAVLGASFASKMLGGADPIGKDVMVNGLPFRVVGILGPMMIFSEDHYIDANGILVPLEAYMDRLEPSHRLGQIGVKLNRSSDLKEVSAMMLGRARQAHHGIEDVEVQDLNQEMLRGYKQFMGEMRGWRIVVYSLAGTVLLVGGVGVLSVMLISFSDRRYEIGLRKSMGASDQQIFMQFLLEALVLASLGAMAGTITGALVCRALSSMFPYGLIVNPYGLLAAWATALGLALVFGLYPAFRAMKLSPMEAMR